MTTSCHGTSCCNTSAKPTRELLPNCSRNAPRRRSPSIKRVRAPERARAMARLADTVDLPSFGTALVTSMVFGLGPSYGMKRREDLILRYDSAKMCLGSYGCSNAIVHLTFSFGIWPTTFSEK